ncbi:hypothetical protein GQ53DRAFT_651444, partial [Thozetella sp. PMI_491]
DVEEAVFWRFAQFVHTGSYTGFASVGEDGPRHSNNANDSVAGGAEEQTDGSSPGERLPQAHSGAHPKASCGPSEKKRDCISAFIAQCGSLTGVDNEGLEFRRALSTRRTRSVEHLLIHAKVWFLAERYAMASLMELACSYLVDELAQWTISASDFVPKFSALVRYVYANRTAGRCRLERLVAQFAACMVEDVMDFEGWSGLLHEVPDFTTDLVRQMTDRFA